LTSINAFEYIKNAGLMMIINIKNKAYLAIDTANPLGMVIIFSEGRALFSKSLPHKMSHGKEICRVIDEAIHFCNQQNLKLEALLVGIGPGSFVGIRIGLAFALGFAFARGLPLMAFCSHQALAWSIAEEEQVFTIFMKASGMLGYVSEFVREGELIKQQGTTLVLSADDVTGHKIFTDMPESIKKVPKNMIHGLFGPSALGIAQVTARRLSLPIFDESDLIKPNYIKPPNVSLPKNPGIMCGVIA